MIDVYVSPEHAGTSTANLAGWYVEWGAKGVYLENSDGNTLSIARRSLTCGRSQRTRANDPMNKVRPGDGTLLQCFQPRSLGPRR